MTQTATQQPAQPPPDLVTVADVMRPPLTTAEDNDHVAAAGGTPCRTVRACRVLNWSDP
jgi:hypothetical protein